MIMDKQPELTKWQQFYRLHREQELARFRARKNSPEWQAKASAMGVAYRERIRIAALTHYGNGTLACVRCGYSGRALQLDHIHDNGARERGSRSGYHGGHKLYRLLGLQGFPEGYQTLCANCNWEKEFKRRRFLRKDS